MGGDEVSEELRGLDKFDDCVDLAVGRLRRMASWAEEQQSEPYDVAVGQMRLIASELRALAREIDATVHVIPKQ